MLFTEFYKKDIKAAKFDLLAPKIDVNSEIIKNVLNSAMESEEYAEFFKKILNEDE